MSRKQFCPKGHDTFIVYRDQSGRCNQCVKDDHPPHPRIAKQFCIHGHNISICGRTKNRTCKDCQKFKDLTYPLKHKEEIRGQRKQHYIENKATIRERQKEYDAAHRDEIALVRRQYRLDNLEYFKTYAKEYRVEHPEKFILSTSKRRKRLVSWDQMGIKEFYENCPAGMEVDHIIPLQGKNVSGLHILSNLQYLNSEENNFKHNKWDGTLENNGWRKKFNVSTISH
jgi:hypothetical protein